MALTLVLVADGLHHAKSQGSIDIGSGVGQVAATGSNQLLQVALPFDLKVITPVGFAEQSYVFCKSSDGNVSDVRPDATPVVFPPSGPPLAQFRVDITAAPAAVELWYWAWQSAGR